MKFIVTHDKMDVPVSIDARQLRREVWKVLRKGSLAAERRIKSAMPVDTGRARASWGHFSPRDFRVAGAGLAADAVWEADKENLSITQGSNVEYVPRLNDGSSRQAPAGFIDAAAEKASQEVDEQIDQLLARLIRGF